MAIVVSESAAEESLQAYAHPLSIQAKAIGDLEDRILNGDVVADGNNVFTYLTEFSSNMVASIVNKACNCFNSLYPENAQTSTDLYKHLSDFDYIGLFATPAEMTIELVFDRNYLIDNAVLYNNQYYKIVVPEYSTIKVGEYTFGLMYPIEIRIRKAPNLPNGQTDYDNSIITVMWDLTNDNPLKTMEAHILEHRDFTQDGQVLTAIQVPIYQFQVESHLENAIASTGFAKRYDYMDKFYAIRVFHFKGGKWNEMAQTLSDINYDVDIPTAMIKVLMDIGKVEVVIPQIYFNSTKESSLIGNRILVKIYTTQGELDVNISDYSVDQFSASFLMTDQNLVEDDTYSNMLKRITTCYILPASTRISSGTDGITMDELKERVKHSASYTVKITADDLDAYFATSGFTFTKDLDNITDRVYCAHKVVRDSTGTTIASGDGKTYLTPEMTNITLGDDNEYYIPGYSSIVPLNQESITIQPSAIYKYDEDNDRFVMLSDDELSVFNSMTTENKVSKLNSGLYSYSPFHVRMSLNSTLPIAGSYDLYNPTLKSIVFSWENPNTTSEIAIYTANIEALATENKGYRLTVALFKTESLSDVEPLVDDGLSIKNIQVMLSTTNSTGVYMYMLGTYDGKDSEGHDVFIFDIKSKFKITSEDMIDVLNMYDSSGGSDGNYLDIDSHEYMLSFFVKEEFIDEEYPMEGVSLVGIPTELDGYVYLCAQTFKLKLGEALPLLQNNVSIGVSDQKYATYPTTQFATYTVPVYKRWTVQNYLDGIVDPMTGSPVVASKIGTLYLNKIESNEYYLTTDVVFMENKDYYTRSASTPYTYTKASVVVSQTIPANTYYNKKAYKVSPVIESDEGDVIISSPYGFNYGPVCSVKEGSSVTSVSLQKPYTTTSSISNVWYSISGDIYMYGSKYTSFTGMYNLEERSAQQLSKVWKQQSVALAESYDTTTLHYLGSQEITLYKRVNDDGTIEMSTEPFEEGEFTTLRFKYSGDYLSSNSDVIKNKISAANTNVNTTARGTQRKWYLVNGVQLIDGGQTDAKFNFDTYVGFVIEYNAVATGNEGVEKKWSLNYYYKSSDASSGLSSNEVILIESDLDTTCAYLSDDDKEKFNTDSYVAMYQTVYHMIKFSQSHPTYGDCWLIGESADGVSAFDEYYYAQVVVSENDTTLNPWEVEWKPIKTDDYSTPVVQSMNSTSNNYKIDIVEALNYIISYLSAHSQTNQELSKLYKYIDEGTVVPEGTILTEDTTYYTRSATGNALRPYQYTKAEVETGSTAPADTYYTKTSPYLVDPLADISFTCVTTCNSGELYVLTEDTVFTKGNYYFLRTGTGETSDPYVYNMAYIVEEDDPDVEYADGIYGQTIPANKFYNRTQVNVDGRTQDYCNSMINYMPGDDDPFIPERKLEVGTDTAPGAIYYKDPDAIAFNYKSYSLTVDQLLSIVEIWNKYRVYSETVRYEYVVEETGIDISIVKLVVSESDPCFFSPWRKLVNVSSYNAVCSYYDERVIVNCKVDDLLNIQTQVKAGYTSFANLQALKDDTPDYTYKVATGIFKEEITYYKRTGAGTTESPYVYTEAHDYEIGEAIPANTYYLRTFKTVFVQDITDMDATDASGALTPAARALRVWLGMEDPDTQGSSLWAAYSKLGTMVSPTCGFVEQLKTDSGSTVTPIRCGYKEDECKKAILSYGTYSGFMYVIYNGTTVDEETTYDTKYINYTSRMERTYTKEQTTFTSTGFNIDIDTSLWSEIDKWPWEIDSPWIDSTKSTIADIDISYNTSVSCAKLLHLNTDIVTDNDGNPVVATNGGRSAIYDVNMLHCDYKLVLSNDADYINYVSDVRELLRSYFNELITISPSLLARTKIYYTPIRTFGSAEFKGSNGNNLTLPLEFSVALGLHVESYVNGSELNKETIRTSILSLIDERLKEGYLNLALLAKDIMTDMNDNIVCVDVLGINGNNQLQTMIPVSEDCYPQLKQTLTVNDDGSVHTTRRLDITWYVVD